MEKRGIRTALPTEVLENYPPVGTIDVLDTISWADIEKDVSAWMGNERQHTAYSAIQKAAAFAKDKTIWRYSPDKRSLLLHGLQVRDMRRGAQLLQPPRG